MATPVPAPTCALRSCARHPQALATRICCGHQHDERRHRARLHVGDSQQLRVEAESHPAVIQGAEGSITPPGRSRPGRTARGCRAHVSWEVPPPGCARWLTCCRLPAAYQFAPPSGNHRVATPRVDKPGPAQGRRRPWLSGIHNTSKPAYLPALPPGVAVRRTDWSGVAVRAATHPRRALLRDALHSR
jgi:hypothetical protein